MTEQAITPEVLQKLSSEVLGQPVQGDSVLEAAMRALANKEAEQALQMIGGEVIPFTQKDVEKVLIENLGKKDPSGEKKAPRSSLDRERYIAAKKTAEAVREYLELKDPQNIPQELVDQVKNYLIKQENFREVFSAQNINADDLVKSLLQKPQVRERLRELYIERLDPSKRLESEILVEQLEKEIEAIKRELIDLDEINDEIAKLQAEIRGARHDMEIDPNYAEYEKINKQIQSLQRGLEQYEEERKGNPSIRLDLFVGPGFGSVEDVLNKISELRRELADDRFKEIRNLQETIEKNQNQIQSLEEKKSHYDPEKQTNLRQQLAQKEAELREARAKLLAERMEYAESIRNIPETAVKEYLDGALAEAAKYYKQEAQKAAEEEEEKTKRLLDSAIEKLSRRLGRKEGKAQGEEVYLPDKEAALPLLAALGRPNGLEEFINQFANSENTLKEIYGLSEKEAQAFHEKLQSDPEYRKTVAQDLAKKVLADYIRAGGKLDRNMVEAIINSDWGKSIIEDGRNLAKEQKKLIESVADKNFFEKGWEWVKQNDWKLIKLILIFILIGVGVGGAVALAHSKGLF